MRDGRGSARGVVRRRVAACALAVTTALGALAALPGTAAGQPGPRGASDLYLVTLGPGTAADGPLDLRAAARRDLRVALAQQRALRSVGAPDPVYRWRTALNGLAVRLTQEQADQLRADPSVGMVERNRVLPLAGSAGTAPATPAAERGTGGAGVVIGIVDTGLAPDGPVFASAPGLGAAPKEFRGACEPAQDWAASDCNGKVLSARWFVDGFGTGRIMSTATLSARDDDGHGTALASLAAGNAGVSTPAGSQDLGRFAGVAPQARLAVYKACWSAPDPTDDGCATADVVTAIDRAVADGVDVLNLAAGGTGSFDTVEQALLGAAEADVVVVAAAGNEGVRGSAAHPSPWVTTVGGTHGVVRTGRAELRGGPRLAGAMASRRTVEAAPVVLGRDVPAAGVAAARARVCAPGALDAARVAERVVVCERGKVGRVDKSAAVEQADGVGMVLVNTRRQSVAADLHSVPTVHVAVADGRRLRRWLDRSPAARITLAPAGRVRSHTVMPWSSPGDPAGAVLKPDLLAAGAGLLAAAPAEPEARGSARWDIVAGTSAASAYTSGAAALLLARHAWPAATVRSALATSAAPVRGSALRTGAGRLRPDTALRPALAHEVDPADYRRWLSGRLRGELNTPSILLHDHQRSTRRTITNVGRRTLYFSSSTSGFRAHDVTVTPAAVRLDPGESATYTVRVAGHTHRRPTDDGTVTWRGANGTVTRVPVLLTR